MDFNDVKLDQNGMMSFPTNSGESIDINTNDKINNEILIDVFNTRLNEIDPKIGDINWGLSSNPSTPNQESLTPIEEAEFDFLKLRVSNLEAEKSNLLSLVDKLKKILIIDDNPSNIQLSNLVQTKIKMKSFVKRNKWDELLKYIDSVVKKNSSLYNEFLAVLSRYGRLKSEMRFGTIPREDFTYEENQITASILKVIDELSSEDIIEKI